VIGEHRSTCPATFDDVVVRTFDGVTGQRRDAPFYVVAH